MFAQKRDRTKGTMKNMKGMKNGVQGIHEAQPLTYMKLSTFAYPSPER
jgi:hypothetical protein